MANRFNCTLVAPVRRSSLQVGTETLDLDTHDLDDVLAQLSGNGESDSIGVLKLRTFVETIKRYNERKAR